jgi:4-amino-4-deoxy-L-arabinose transferase-like glycosyltransferase
MARIAHWVMNESIEPYPTHIYRQIYQPPLAEWMIGQICLLNKADYFANSLQLFFLLGSLGVVNLLMLLCKIEKKTRNIACALVITTPSIFMQATATQNDIVVVFFILCILYFLILFFKFKNSTSALFLGLSIGCALLTKGTAFVYLIPIMGVGVLLLIRSIYQKQFVFLKDASLLLLIVAISLTIPFSHYYRNYKLSNDIFGASEDSYFNENITTKSTLIGIVKNIGIHMSTPITSNITNQIVEKAHLVTNIPISDKKYSYNGIQFKMNNWNHNEDEVSNFFQVILFGFVLLYWIVNRKKQIPTLNYTILFCLFTFFIFTFILKWQPWHMRLQVPLFMFMAIPTAIAINTINKEKISYAILGILSVYCLVLAIYNPNRPLLKNEKQEKLTTRFEKYFVAMPPYLVEYKQWRYCVTKNIPTEWGVHGDTWEYPIYYDCFEKNRKPFSVINIKNQSKKSISLNQ